MRGKKLQRTSPTVAESEGEGGERSERAGRAEERGSAL